MICFALFYQLGPLVLELNFVADNIKLIFSMPNVNIIVDTKLQPYNKLCIVQIKQNRLIVTKEQIKGMNPFYFGICHSVEQ